MPDPTPSDPSPIDEQWVHQAVDQYQTPLTQYAARLVGEVERARDVVQETFLRLCDQKRSELDDHLAQWLYTVCRNLALNVNRKERRMTSLSDAAAKLRPSDEADPQEIVQQRDAHTRAAELLDALPGHQQEVIRLKFQHGLTYRQIAEVTGHPVSTVGYLIVTGLETIRGQMSVTDTAAGGGTHA